MDFYRKKILEILKGGPKSRTELIQKLCTEKNTKPEIMSVKKLQNTLNELVDEGVVVKKRNRTDETHRELTYYALRKHRYLLEVELGQVVKALKYLRPRLCRNPEVEEVAAKIDKDPASVRKILFEHASELEWKPPTPEEKEEAKKSRDKAKRVAALIKYSLDDYIDLSKITIEDIGNADFQLKHHFNAIKTEDYGVLGVVLGLGLPPPSPKERGKEEAIEAIKKLRNLKKFEI